MYLLAKLRNRWGQVFNIDISWLACYTVLMARPLRIEYEGALYHITSRGNERRAIFADDKDREIFLDVLRGVNERFNWLCHAYCLMTNHYHLVIETPDGNLSKGMRNLNGIYTQAYNRRHRRVGHLLQGRFKAILVQKETHSLEVCRYVVLNPVRAKAVSRPEGWKWSSYRATAGIVKPHPYLTVDWILGQFGRKRWQAEKAYRVFVKAGTGEESIWVQLRGQSLLGRDDFVERLSGYLKGRRTIKDIPRNQRYLGRPSLDKLFTEKISTEKQTRDRKILEAVEEYGYSQNELADHLGLHYSTISRLVNERRERHQN